MRPIIYILTSKCEKHITEYLYGYILYYVYIIYYVGKYFPNIFYGFYDFLFAISAKFTAISCCFLNCLEVLLESKFLI